MDKASELMNMLEIKAKLNNFNYIDYCESHIDAMNDQFDNSWQNVYGYHPKNLPDYWS